MATRLVLAQGALGDAGTRRDLALRDAVGARRMCTMAAKHPAACTPQRTLDVRKLWQAALVLLHRLWPWQGFPFPRLPAPVTRWPAVNRVNAATGLKSIAGPMAGVVIPHPVQRRNITELPAGPISTSPGHPEPQLVSRDLTREPERNSREWRRPVARSGIRSPETGRTFHGGER